MRLKKERQQELNTLNSTSEELQLQVSHKEKHLLSLKKDLKNAEAELSDAVGKVKKLEQQQSSVKKVEEFNALTHETSSADRERIAKEHRISDLIDRLHAEEETLKGITEVLKSTLDKHKTIQAEIIESITNINEEGSILKVQREELKDQAEEDVLRIYERLFQNKRDRVVVPIENRCCSGCHIMVTAQDENLVRKGERLIFCEHCSRIHYWQESQALEGSSVASKPRRRRSTKV